ncbi:MAG: 30S ribosomal protein S13 [Candidatus Aenigmatarchaeota archaeon]
MGVTKVKEEKIEEKPKEREKVKEEKKPKEVKARKIVRVLNTDLDGEKPLMYALRGIKGVSFTFSKAVCEASGINPKIKLGSLGEEDIQKIEKIIKNPLSYGIPPYLLNRRKDRETGKDLHLSGADVEIYRKFDIQRMIDLKTYKGIRHMLGLPVRGQRTRSSFRKGRVVGVVRKAVRIATEKKEKKEEKK